MTEELPSAFPPSVIRAMTFKTTMKHHLASQVVRTPCFHCEAVGLIPGWVTKTLQAEWCDRKEKKEMKINSLERLLRG